MAGEKILVIDDSPTILKVVQLVLTKAGFQVATAADGEAGVEAARSVSPDLILLDFVMPKMNGYQVCRALAEDEALKDVPVVLMSAKGDQVGERFVKVMGIVDYITKPFSPEAITAVVTHTLAKRAGGAAPEASPAGAAAQPQAAAAAAPGPSTPEQLTKAATVAQDSRRAGLQGLREGVIRAVAGGVIAHSDFVDLGLDAARLAEVVRTALSDDRLEVLLGELRGVCPELADTAAAVLTGDLQVVPLADILGLLQTQQQGGVLTVTRAAAKIELHFREGRIDLATAAGMPEEFLLGRFLADAAGVDETVIDEQLREREGGPAQLTGSHLVKQGVVEPDDLRAALTKQTCELVYELLRWSYGRFTFRAAMAPSALALEAHLNLSVDGILMEGFRRVDEWHLIEREVDTFDLTFLRNDDAVQQMGRGRLTREEIAVLELVNGKNTVKDIIRQSRMSSFDVSKMLYRLLSIKLIRKRVAPVAV
jgi:DNA-binding response OmpR family regulator